MREDVFDQIASVYDQIIPEHIIEHYTRRREVFIVRLLKGKEKLILDVGCGTGRLDEKLSRGGLKVVSLDHSSGMLQELTKRGGGEPVQGSAVQLPFKSGTFDLVISIVLLHHLFTPQKVAETIREMVRVVKRGGKVFIWDHNPLNPYWYFFMRRLPQDRGKTRLVPLSEIVANLKGCEIASLQIYRIGAIADFIPRALLYPFKILESYYERAPLIRRLAAHNVVVAKKD